MKCKGLATLNSHKTTHEKVEIGTRCTPIPRRNIHQVNKKEENLHNLTKMVARMGWIGIE